MTTPSTTAWQDLGRDAAHTDTEYRGDPCETIAEARRRCEAWLRSPPTLDVTDAEIEECAASYLRAWQAHARDAAT